MKLLHWLCHDWDKWQDGEATYTAGPLALLLGAPKSWKSEAQVRYCKVCNEQEMRRVRQT